MTINHDASGDGDALTVRTLLSTADVLSLINPQVASGVTSLHFVAQNGHVSVTKQLILGKHGYTPLHARAEKGHAIVAKKLIEAHCNVDLHQKHGCTSIFTTAEKGHVSVTEELIEARCNIDVQSNYRATHLHHGRKWACFRHETVD